MSIDINLVNKQTSEGSRDIRLKKIKIISFAVLIIVASLSVILFLINLRFSVNYVQNQQNRIIQELSAYDKTTSKLFVLNQRLSDINSIKKERKQYQEKTDLLFKKIPGGVKIQDYTIDESGASMNLTSASLLDLDTFLNYLLGLSKSKKINSIVLDQLSSAENGYSMKIIIN